VRIVQWTQPARESYDAFLEYFLERDKRRAIRARNDLQDALALICQRPQIGRRSEWLGLKRWSVPEWDKISSFAKSLTASVSSHSTTLAKTSLSLTQP